jgi:hypothetical protein
MKRRADIMAKIEEAREKEGSNTEFFLGYIGALRWVLNEEGEE